MIVRAVCSCHTAVTGVTDSIRGLDVSVVRCDDFRELLNEPSNMEQIPRKPPVLEEAQACQLLDGMMTAFPFLQ